MTSIGFQTSRRSFLRRALAASAAGVAVPIAALAEPAGAEAVEGEGPYGPLADRDASGVLLPAGFQAQTVAVSHQIVADTGYRYRAAPDGAATFADGSGGWFHAINHEAAASDGGGVSCLHFNADGEIVDAYSILEGTNRNCAGGPTPWGTWLSCEEVADGLVWECAPGHGSQGVPRPALGVFNHEAVAVDPIRRQLYLTEDRSDGLLYRFTPDRYPALDSGRLEAARFDGGVAAWVEIADPSAASGETRHQRRNETTPFDGGEGIWYHNDHIYFTTKGDHGVWDLDVVTGALERVWSGRPGDASADQLTGVDNITVESGSGDLYVAEDGGNMEIVLITPEGTVSPFLRIEGHRGSELTGPVFSPDGTRLLFSSQRGSDGNGVTYLVTGPFRGTLVATPTTDTGVTAPNAKAEGADGADGATAEVADGADGATADGATRSGEQTLPTAPPVPDDRSGSLDGDHDVGVEPEPDRPAGVRSDSEALSAALDPATPDPGATFTGAVATREDGLTAWLAGAAGALGLAGVGLVALRRRGTNAEADASSTTT